MASSPCPRDRVLLPTRILAVVIVPFLVLAFFVLYPWPGDTRRLFAWQIKPTMSAMVLGSVYLGGAYFFVRAARAQRWHEIAGGFVPVGCFASLMGVTTILHWSRFLHGNVAFWLWVALYFSTPFAVFAVWLNNNRRERSAERDQAELLISPLVAAVVTVAGGLSALTCLLLYLFPRRAISVWPWQLTPLTARMLSAVFVLGIAGLGAVRERRWSAMRLLVEVAGLMLTLILIAGVRARHEFAASRPLTWVFGIGFVLTAIAVVVLYLRMQTRARVLHDG